MIKTKYRILPFNILLWILIFFNHNIFSQDIIIKINNDSIFCNIISVGTQTIKYDSTKYSDDIVFEINRSDVLKIFFENKSEIKLYKDSLDISVIAKQNKNALKLYLLSPVFGHFQIGYERTISLNASLEFGVSYIYGMYNQQRTEKGGTARMGFKFINLKDYSMGNTRFVNIMKAPYFKPELLFSAFNSSYTYTDEYGDKQLHSDDVFSFSLLLNYGVQYIYDNKFLLDFYVGIGASIASDEVDFYYTNVSFPYERDEFSLCISMGIKIGGLF